MHAVGYQRLGIGHGVAKQRFFFSGKHGTLFRFFTCGTGGKMPLAATPTAHALRQIVQITLGIQRGHATGAGAGDGLAIDVILHVTGSENTGN